jgi:hypothetical protein
MTQDLAIVATNHEKGRLDFNQGEAWTSSSRCTRLARAQ